MQSFAHHVLCKETWLLSSFRNKFIYRKLVSFAPKSEHQESVLTFYFPFKSKETLILCLKTLNVFKSFIESVQRIQIIIIFASCNWGRGHREEGSEEDATTDGTKAESHPTEGRGMQANINID